MADALREALKLHASSEANAAANRAMGSASECNELVNAVRQAQEDVEDTLDVACIARDEAQEARGEAQEARDEARDEAHCVQGLAAEVEEHAYKAQCHEENTGRIAEATRAELAKAVAKTGADRDELAEELAVAKMNKHERQIHKANRAADAAMAAGSQKKLKAFF